MSFFVGFYFFIFDNGYRIYVDIMTEENCCMDNTYWSVRSSSRRVMNRVKELDGEYMKIWCNIQVIVYPLFTLSMILILHLFKGRQIIVNIKKFHGSKGIRQ